MSECKHDYRDVWMASLRCIKCGRYEYDAPKKRLAALEREREELAHALLAGEMVVRDSNGSPVVIPPNLIAHARVLVHERSLLRARVEKLKGELDAAKAKIKELETLIQFSTGEL